jgi:hypothetical protein
MASCTRRGVASRRVPPPPAATFGERPLSPSPDDEGAASAASAAEEPTLAAKAASFAASIFDFEAWAPKSSRVWRLQVPPKGFEAEQAARDAADAAFLDGLNARLGGPGGAAARADARATMSASEDEAEESGGEEEVEEERCTSDAALAASLAARLAAADAPALSPSSSPSRPEPPLTGGELAAGVLAKYGLPYDLTLVRRNLAGIRVVALNVMWAYVGQRSAISAEAYADKCDALAAALSAWGCAAAVRAFLAEPPKSKRGLPGRPVVGNAVSLRLDVDPDVVGEWLGR